MKVEITKEVGYITYNKKPYKKGDVVDIRKEDAVRLIGKGQVKSLEETEEEDAGEKKAPASKLKTDTDSED